jgi:hypothetical protein
MNSMGIHLVPKRKFSKPRKLATEKWAGSDPGERERPCEHCDGAPAVGTKDECQWCKGTGKRGDPRVAPDAEVEYFWLDELGSVKSQTREWKRGRTAEAIEAWVGEYLGRVAEGYLPAGFVVAPRPYRAVVRVKGVVVAEWRAAGEKTG